MKVELDIEDITRPSKLERVLDTIVNNSWYIPLAAMLYMIYCAVEAHYEYEPLISTFYSVQAFGWFLGLVPAIVFSRSMRQGRRYQKNMYAEWKNKNMQKEVVSMLHDKMERVPVRVMITPEEFSQLVRGKVIVSEVNSHMGPVEIAFQDIGVYNMYNDLCEVIKEWEDKH